MWEARNIIDGKEINVTLEDALYSPLSMALMFGGQAGIWENVETVKRQLQFHNPVGTDHKTTVPEYVNDNGEACEKGDPKAIWKVDKAYKYDETTNKIVDTDTPGAGSLTGGEMYILDVSPAEGMEVKGKTLKIDADDFPGTYKLVGDTWARSRETGKDEYFQFVIPRAKMQAEETLTLEAEGDPTTFNLNMRVLRPRTGHMIELIQYQATGTPTAE